MKERFFKEIANRAIKGVSANKANKFNIVGKFKFKKIKSMSIAIVLIAMVFVVPVVLAGCSSTDSSLDKVHIMNNGCFITCYNRQNSNLTNRSKLQAERTGVLAPKIVDIAKPAKDAKFVLISSYDGYSTNVGIEDFSFKNSIFAVKYNGDILSRENGFPVRLIIPIKYAYKRAKWVRRVTFLEEKGLGY